MCLAGPFDYRAWFVMLRESVTCHINTAADRDVLASRRTLLMKPSD